MSKTTYILVERDCETLDELREFLDQISFEQIDGGAALYEVTVAGNAMAKKSPVVFRARLQVADTDA